MICKLTALTYDCSSINTASKIKPGKDYPFSDAIPVDPGSQLTMAEKEAFIHINQKYDSVFDPCFKGYNDCSGPIRANISR